MPSSVPTSCRPYSLNVSAAYSCARRSRAFLRGHEVEIALEHVRVVRRRPVAVRDVPAALVDQDLEVREDLEVVDAPARDARRVDARERLAEVRRVPRPRAPAAGERLGWVEMLGGPVVLVRAARGHHAVRPVELVVRRLELVLGVLSLGRGAELVRVQRRHVVVLLEGVAEHLPVAVVLGAERVALGHPVERIAFERADHRSQVVPQRLAGLAGEVHEDEPGPGVAVHRARGRARPCADRRTRSPGARRCTRRRGRSASRGTCRRTGERCRRSRRGAYPPTRSLLPRCRHTLWKARTRPSMSRDTMTEVLSAGQLLGEVAAVPRQLLHPPDVEPGAPEDRLALELVERGRDRVLERHGRRAELRIVLGPRALRRFLEASHSLFLPSSGHCPEITFSCIKNPVARY